VTQQNAVEVAEIEKDIKPTEWQIQQMMTMCMNF